MFKPSAIIWTQKSSLLCILVLVVGLVSTSEGQDLDFSVVVDNDEAKSPCDDTGAVSASDVDSMLAEYDHRDGRAKKERGIRPMIRVLDEVRRTPPVYLGKGGLRYYVLSQANAPPGGIVIECSSGIGPLEWEYKGRGVSHLFLVLVSKGLAIMLA